MSSISPSSVLRARSKVLATSSLRFRKDGDFTKLLEIPSCVSCLPCEDEHVSATIGTARLSLWARTQYSSGGGADPDGSTESRSSLGSGGEPLSGSSNAPD